jgi:hypothetical protein
MGLLYGRAGRLTALFGVFRRGQQGKGATIAIESYYRRQAHRAPLIEPQLTIPSNAICRCVRVPFWAFLTGCCVYSCGASRAKSGRPGNCSSADPEDDRGGVVAVLHDGSGRIIPGGAERWKAFDATAAFSPSDGRDGEGSGTGSYAQPHEDIDARLYPQGWRTAAFDASAWSAAAARPPFAASLAAKEALPAVGGKVIEC